MAESLSNTENIDLTNSSENDSLECAVCLQTCIHPAQLPCGHIFCFLCIKGIANRSKRCAMCRQEIPREFVDNPHLLSALNVTDVQESVEDSEYRWFYEGRNGWWQYDERTSKELECSYKAGDATCELLIAGFLYVTDFVAMLQLRRNEPLRRRRIKRDLSSIPKKGIAGLRTTSDSSVTDDSSVTAVNVESNEPTTNVTTANTTLSQVTAIDDAMRSLALTSLNDNVVSLLN